MKLALSSQLSTVQVGFDKPATEERDSMLAVASFIQVIECQDTYDGAITVLREINSFLKQLEEDRKSVKGPVTELGRRIDGACSDFVKVVEIEKDRISKMINSYTRKVEEEKARVAAEQRRRQEEILAKQRAEQARIEREGAAAMMQARTDAEAVAARARMEADQAMAKAASEAAQAAVMTPAIPASPKTEGTATRRPWRYEVLNIAVLYQSRPELVKLEPRGREILVEVAKGIPIPGLRAWQDTEVTVKT